MKKPIDMMMDGVAWNAVPEDTGSGETNGLPHATHSGILEIGPLRIECLRLSDGRAVISEQGMHDFLEWMGMIEGRPPTDGGKP